MGRRENEEKISQFWEAQKIFERSVSERPLDKQFVFYDGPPFATGLPHYGHILGLTSKDLFPRYETMKGNRVERRWGWDCHGLPVENIAEKELGIRDKKEIEKMGIDKFNEFCRSKVLYFASEWKKTVRTMGKWIEFDNSYKTMDNSYMESVWWIFKELHKKGLIYKGKKILLYCPHCQTPLANSEIQMDNSYKDVTEKTATVAFKLKGKDEYIVAWTTTPWTLLGNVALAVNPELIYVKVESFGKTLILAKDLVEKNLTHFKVLEEFWGKDLLGVEYEPLYAMPNPENKKGHYVIDGGKDVTAEEGTGIVHMALYGEFDYQMIKKYDLPIVQHIANNGTLAVGPTQWIGVWFKKLDPQVIADLDSRGILIEAKSYTHPYPFCYRCETPLIYNAVDSWFVDIQKVKPRLMEKAKDINWYPESIKEGRFKYILQTAPDWSISRNRFWATAIPVWECECGKSEVFGSVADLAKRATQKVPADLDLHKHIVDPITVKCQSCGKEMKRIPEVLDCWFESGSMPYAAKHYPFENKDWFNENYPADFISEYIAQVRAWFYYMHVLGVLLFDKAPFENVVVSGTVLAADGSKMSKSKNNFTDPNKLFDLYGADAMRFYLMSSQLMRAQDLNFIDDNVKEVHRKLITMLVNIKQFYTLFRLSNKEFDDDNSHNILDKWIISKTHRLVRNATQNLNAYETLSVCSEALAYVDDLSTWFVRRSRDRFKSDDAAEKNAALRTLAFALDRLSKVLAPIAPFISEEIFQSIRGLEFSQGESVHLAMWPTFNETKIDDALEKRMVLVREAVSKALDERKKANIAVKQPLPKITISGAALETDLLPLICDEVNVKQVVLKNFVADAPLAVELDTTITPELAQEGLLREFIRHVNALRKDSNLTLNDKIVLSISSDAPDVAAVLAKYADELKKSVQATSIVTQKTDNAKEVTLQGNKAFVGISVVTK